MASKARALGSAGRDNPGGIEPALHAALLKVGENFPARQLPVAQTQAALGLVDDIVEIVLERDAGHVDSNKDPWPAIASL